MQMFTGPSFMHTSTTEIFPKEQSDRHQGTHNEFLVNNAPDREG